MISKLSAVESQPTRLIRVSHLSPDWVAWLDEQVGQLKAKNGGFGELMARFERGEVRGVRLITSFLPADWQQE